MVSNAHVPTAKTNAAIRDVRAALANSLKPTDQALERRLIEQLRLAGATRDEVVNLVVELLGPADALKIQDDLDSYGEWNQ